MAGVGIGREVVPASYSVLGPHGGQAWSFATRALVNGLWHL